MDRCNFAETFILILSIELLSLQPMAGTTISRLKQVCKKYNIEFSVWQSNIANGLKWCYACKDWKSINEFSIDNSRYDGKKSKCHACDRVKVRQPITPPSFKGRKHTPEARLQMSEKRKRGGKLKLLTTIRNSPEYKFWRMRIFERDKFQCVLCSKHKSELKRKHLQADHIKPLFLIVKENELLTMKDAVSCKELWDLNNGRTLCMACHTQTDSFGSKSTNNYG